MSSSGGVLLVEGESPFRMLTLQAIQAAGRECFAVGDLATALEEAKRVRPHLIVLDCASIMPGDEQLLARVEELRRLTGAPLIILAGLDTPTEFIESLSRVGGEDCLFKPLQTRQLQLRLEAASSPRPPSAHPLARWGAKTVSLVHGRGTFAQRTGELLEQSGYHVRYESLEDERAAREESGVDLHILCTDSREELAHALQLRQPAGLPPGSRWFLICTEGPGHLATHTGGTLIAGFDMARVLPEQIIQKANAWFSRAIDALQPEARVPFFCPVEYREAGNIFGSWSSCFSYDLSPGGIFLRTLVPARPGAAVELKIHLTTLRMELLGSGVVAWSNAYAPRKTASYPTGMGVHFLGMSPRGLAQLRELCGVDPTARKPV
ncbi:response regulator [Archangium violaceum]|uniref:response regulator n=1 Tax=Archangium violaceum TaxID=83451 RepID=UPI0019521667|nr:response regulator [Archangium violaceum]QRO00656.1 response regulator [Archangium violaceum]